MKDQDITGILPAQYTGKEIEAKASVELNDDNAARAFYEVVKNRLLTVNHWHHIAGIISATFQVVNANGNEVDRAIEKGDYLKIDIPGPGNKEGDGYDWVCVEDVKEADEENIESIGFRVRPAKNPLGEKNEIAHFYTNEATSNFMVTREKSKVSAWIVDRNIRPNDNPQSLTDKIRDTAVGIGAIGIFSKIQWQNLASGLVKTSDD